MGDSLMADSRSDRGGPRRPPLIEWFVVVLVVATAVAAIVPALLASREDARRARCAGNLRQLALAALCYVDIHGRLPSGSFDVATHPRNFSVFARLLPHLGEDRLYDAINLSLAHVDVENLTIGTLSLGVWCCPSDSEASRPAPAHCSGNPNSPSLVLPGEWPQRFCSYAGNAGTWDMKIDPHAPDFGARKAAMNGTIFGMSSVTPAEITDGAGHTMLFGERAHGMLAVRTIATQLDSWTGPALAEYHFWQSGETVDALFETWAPPNQYKAGVGSPRAESLPFLAANAGGFHPPGGAYFAFCDGSVRFLKDTIDSWRVNQAYLPSAITYDKGAGVWSLRPGMRPGVYQALSTRNGGEPLPGGGDSDPSRPARHPIGPPPAR
jgi:prepilin-type processing-associated H-X9-DG protein